MLLGWRRKKREAEIKKAEFMKLNPYENCRHVWTKWSDYAISYQQRHCTICNWREVK